MRNYVWALPSHTGIDQAACVMYIFICLAQVPLEELQQAATMIKSHMESTAHLRVPLRVKLHAGPSWGRLEVLDLGHSALHKQARHDVMTT